MKHLYHIMVDTSNRMVSPRPVMNPAAMGDCEHHHGSLPPPRAVNRSKKEKIPFPAPGLFVLSLSEIRCTGVVVADSSKLTQAGLASKMETGTVKYEVLSHTG